MRPIALFVLQLGRLNNQFLRALLWHRLTDQCTPNGVKASSRRKRGWRAPLRPCNACALPRTPRHKHELPDQAVARSPAGCWRWRTQAVQHILQTGYRWRSHATMATFPGSE